MKKINILFFMVFMTNCGFLNNGTGAFDSDISDIDDREEVSGGLKEADEERSEVPVHTHRVSDKACAEGVDCQRICQLIYNEEFNHDRCYSRSYGDVADMQNVFYALTEEDISHQMELLKKTSSHSLQLYLNTGLEGFRDKVMSKIEQYPGKLENYRNILRWISKNKEIVGILDEEDINNEILLKMLLNYAQITGFECSDIPLQDCLSDHHRSICGCRSNNIFLDNTTGEMIYHLPISSHYVTIASLRPHQKNLLKVLSFVDSEGWNFLLYSAGQSLRYHAFIWAYSLVKDACVSEHKTLMKQCIAGFLCWLEGVDSDINLLIADADVQSQMIPEVVQSLQNGCRF